MALQDEKLSIASLTGGERQGEGVFEELMRAAKSHLSAEYDAGRITGDNFTEAYIATLGQAMNTGAQYLLQHEVQNQQIRLMDEQIAAAKLQTQLVQSQIDRAAQDLVYVTKQTLKLDSDIALVDSQVAVQTKQLLVQQSQVDNAAKDILVKDSQITYQGKQGAMVDQQTSNAVVQGAQILVQTSKIRAEEVILTQRAVTEEAQTKDIVAGNAVGGIVGKQMALYGNQADGYIRDAEQKVAKLMNDTFITRVSTDWDNPSAANAGIDDIEVNKVMTVLKAGVGV